MIDFIVSVSVGGIASSSFSSLSLSLLPSSLPPPSLSLSHPSPPPPSSSLSFPFPPLPLPSQHYSVVDASQGQVFIAVYHSFNNTNLYLSEEQGLNYSLSLEYIISPPESSWNNPTFDVHVVSIEWEVGGGRGEGRTHFVVFAMYMYPLPLPPLLPLPFCTHPGGGNSWDIHSQPQDARQPVWCHSD